LGRFPQQQPFELFEELVCFSAAQLGLDAGLLEFYRRRQPTISEHQQTITGYLRLRPFDDAEAAQLKQFLFEEACRLEQAAALMGQAREFLKERSLDLLKPATRGSEPCQMVNSSGKTSGNHPLSFYGFQIAIALLAVLYLIDLVALWLLIPERRGMELA
jgi:Domain of unknown function (DUF4158)